MLVPYLIRIVETLCMKGLILTHLGRREEGFELVKQGVRLDLTSHICWHVFGLIQKGQKNYEEALKSYTQALRFDKVRSAFYSVHISIPPREDSSIPYLHYYRSAVSNELPCNLFLSLRTTFANICG